MGYVIRRVTERRERVRIRALTGLGMGAVIALLTSSERRQPNRAVRLGRIMPISGTSEAGCLHAQRPEMVLVKVPNVAIAPSGPGGDDDWA